VFDYKPNEDNTILCDPELLVPDEEQNIMPVFKHDEIYTRKFDLKFEDVCEEGYLLMPTTFENS